MPTDEERQWVADMAELEEGSRPSRDPVMLAELERLRAFAVTGLLSMAQVDWLFTFIGELLLDSAKLELRCAFLSGRSEALADELKVAELAGQK